jgi:hypothetical protein
MQQILALGKYPVFTTEIAKSSCAVDSVDAIIDFFKGQIEANPITAFIGIFDHYTHTKSIGGSMAPNIQDVKNIVFCFGPAIPTPDMVAVRPRSIGVTDIGDRYVINFLEAPGDMPNQAMMQWVNSLKK